jgi:hypothetical protein
LQAPFLRSRIATFPLIDCVHLIVLARTGDAIVGFESVTAWNPHGQLVVVGPTGMPVMGYQDASVNARRGEQQIVKDCASICAIGEFDDDSRAEETIEVPACGSVSATCIQSEITLFLIAQGRGRPSHRREAGLAKERRDAGDYSVELPSPSEDAKHPSRHGL